MKKIITYEITSEEIEFIKNKPESPCRRCYYNIGGGCCGCQTYDEYKEKIGSYDEEVIELAEVYSLYKDKLKEIEKLKKEAEEIKNSIPEQIFYQ